MIKLENYEVMGWEHAIRGMRNPMNSWDKSDSLFCKRTDCYDCEVKADCGCDRLDFDIGPNDHDLMLKLAKNGSVHAKYRRMITVYVDITAPLYWWKEFDTYKVGTVANSCSTMHKIAEKEFTMEDFSCEHLSGDGTKLFFKTVDTLNLYRQLYLNTNTDVQRNGTRFSEEVCEKIKKDLWWAMIQLLPSSYNQKRTVMLNYEVLADIYQHRREHKLDEWREFCEWIDGLPYAEIIMCDSERNKVNEYKPKLVDVNHTGGDEIWDRYINIL